PSPYHARVIDDDGPPLRRPDDRSEAVALAIEQYCAAGKRELACLAAHLVVAAARGARGTRNADRLQQLTWFEHDLERADHELVDRHASRPAAVGHDAFRGQCAQRWQPVARWVGMTNTAPDGAAIAHRAIGNAAGHGGENRQFLHAHTSILDVGGGDAGADNDSILFFFDVGQFRNGSDVNQDARLDQTQVQHGAERLTAGNDSCAAGRLAENCRGLGEARCARKLEVGRFHGRRVSRDIAPTAIASRACSGASGKSRAFAPTVDAKGWPCASNDTAFMPKLYLGMKSSGPAPTYGAGQRACRR